MITKSTYDKLFGTNINKMEIKKTLIENNYIMNRSETEQVIDVLLLQNKLENKMNTLSDYEKEVLNKLGDLKNDGNRFN